MERLRYYEATRNDEYYTFILILQEVSGMVNLTKTMRVNQALVNEESNQHCPITGWVDPGQRSLLLHSVMMMTMMKRRTHTQSPLPSVSLIEADSLHGIKTSL